MRIGIDVGGTHTDAVLLNGEEVLATTKASTSSDVISGILTALNTVLENAGVNQDQLDAVMIGTTQFTNAVVERRELARVAAIRIGAPSGQGLPPMIDWPLDIASMLGNHTYLLKGGYLYDGWPLSRLEDSDIDKVIKDIVSKDITNIAISSVFSPMNPAPELYVAEKIRKVIPNANITLSHNIGRLGLLERENAAILNTALLPLADKVVRAFRDALLTRGIRCPMFISQNDGTLMSASFIKEYPALTFASGPTNSLRGAYKLSGLANAIVVDVGGTTSDIGVLQDGFPRESSVVIEVGGVRTNFRMPDINAVGLGGGSIVSSNGTSIGPQSVGHRLLQEGLVFGGSTLTATDLIVAAGGAQVGDLAKVAHLSDSLISNGKARIKAMLDQNIEMMKPNSDPVPVILVGGGAILVDSELDSASQIVRPKHAEVANAIGAAIAQIGGEAERMTSYRSQTRDEAIAQVTQDAMQSAVNAGASRASLRVADVEETSIPYMDEGNTRIRVKVIGDIAALADKKEEAQ